MRVCKLIVINSDLLTLERRKEDISAFVLYCIEQNVETQFLLPTVRRIYIYTYSARFSCSICSTVQNSTLYPEEFHLELLYTYRAACGKEFDENVEEDGYFLLLCKVIIYL